MNKTQGDEIYKVERVALVLVTCTFCGARPGAPCTLSSGAPTRMHKARYGYLWRFAGFHYRRGIQYGRGLV